MRKCCFFVCIDPPAGSADVECQLLESAKAGDLDQVQRLLGSFPHIVNCRDLDGRHSTPLHFASGYNRVPVVEYLLQLGADVHAKDKGYIFFYIVFVFFILCLQWSCSVAQCVFLWSL